MLSQFSFLTLATRSRRIITGGSLSRLLLVLAAACWPSFAIADQPVEEDDSKAKQVIPHKQTKPPGPPLSPAEAIAAMTVPEGFKVELVAAEPDLINPVAMAFDARGRIWVTESFEYPRLEAGPGRDRIKILEDTNRDGKIDNVKIFAEGLNIPSGIAIGHGGVWVANAPDLLFMEDTDGDDRADKTTVVVTGFGRKDTHELPNSLTWGPDGCLYGLNGVFNPSRIEQDGRVYEFTCAMFRVDPKTRRFDLFCEGTSNPWGIAFDPQGSAFISACVIDHMWHLTETGYYHRQGGPYPPFTWKINSIATHKHQMAAYCGLTYLDTPAYPESYRDLLYMGNIHGGCINVDRLARNGSTYKATGEPDFMTANDVWFMPVSQQVGPDGCLYVLDWYDRYHCYQDAQRDAPGIDRGHGRLYRVVYGDGQAIPNIDLEKESSATLVDLLGSPNLFFRQQAQRILSQRSDPAVIPALDALILGNETPEKHRMHALFARVGMGKIADEELAKFLTSPSPSVRAWGVRAAGNSGTASVELQKRIIALAGDSSADVQLQVAIAARKIDGIDPLPLLIDVAAKCGQDPLIPHIVWQNLLPLIPDNGPRVLELVQPYDLGQAKALAELLPRVTERMLAP